MSYVKNWLHCVWGTKNRVPFLNPDFRNILIIHIKENAREKGIYIDSINGHREHLHCLLSLNPDQSLSKVIGLIKGESSFWINKNRMTNLRFEWAEEYYSASVSGSHLNKVREYIRTQEAHHRKKSWEEEYNDLISGVGLTNNEG
ncbi:MAG: IS200/IS605 family transposase [Bacteroidales bacterium]